MTNAPPPDDTGAPLVRGASIGRYVVLGLVGRGGMGEVYAAYDPELDRKVAVKLLRTKAGNGVTMTEGRQRTLREAQAIARLSHPSVVTVFDVGTFADKVFIAMEFVEGNTITYWLQAQPRTWRDVLDVFVAAGEGLAAAHEKGIVHRDFKPDNVMVGRNGEVRVMDFGLAQQMASDKPPPVRKVRPPRDEGDADVDEPGTLVIPQAAMAAAAEDSDENLRNSVSGLFDVRLTRTGAMMGTPAYMAPEQFFGKQTDARTDQFSFCVSLYEALYGERPFAGKKLSELTANVVQGTIRSAPAGTKVPQWVRKILLRGLRSAPGERYPTMAEILAALGKDPRAARRRWLAISALVLMPLALGFGIRQSLVDRRAACEGGAEKLAGSWELHPPDQPEGPHQSAIHAAFMRTGKSYAADVYDTVSRALTSYAQSWANMYRETCEATQVRRDQSAEVLDLRMECLQERLNGFHALTDVFSQATGEVVENAVSATGALATLDRCADVPTLRAVVKPPEDPNTVARVAELRKQLALVKARFDAGNWKETLKESPRLVLQARALGYRPVLAESLALVGAMETSANDPHAAEQALIEAYRLADASRHDEVRAEVAVSLVFVTGYQERHFDDARRWAETAEAILQRLGGHQLLRAWLLNNIGCSSFANRDIEGGLAALKRGLALKESILGADHPDVGLSNGNLAFVLEGAGKGQEALFYVERAIAIEEKKLGQLHPSLALQYDNRGAILNTLNRPEDARRSFEQALNSWERELGPQDATLASPLTGIGLSYLKESKSTNAIGPLERAIKLRSGRDADPVEQAQTYFDLAQALWNSRREQSRALHLAEQAKAAYAKAAMEREFAAVDTWLRTRGSG